MKAGWSDGKAADTGGKGGNIDDMRLAGCDGRDRLRTADWLTATIFLEYDSY